MKIKKTAAILSTAALMLTSVGCSAKELKSDEKQIREFTGFFAARNNAISDKNEIQQLIAEKTGAYIKQTWLEDQDDINKIFSDMMISDKYPDFISPDAENCQKLIKEGSFIPLDNYWDKYPNIRNLCTESEWDRVRADDGHIYYIPLFSSTYMKDVDPVHNGEAFWMQVKVLEWAGYPKIKTLDQYFDVLEDFLEANPTDSDGEPFIGYEIQANDAWFFALDNPPMFLDGFPNDGCCKVDPETLEAYDYNLSPTAKRWFSKLNDEYVKGIIDQECFVMSSDQYYSKIASGKVLGMVDQHWNFDYSTRELPPDCTYIPIGVTIDEGIEEHYHDRTAFNDSTGTGISISCTAPEEAVKFINDLLEPEIHNLRFWGVEGIDYKVGEGGVFYQTDKQKERWNDADYIYSHRCGYEYMPYYQGMLKDGINAYSPSCQPDEFFQGLSDEVKRCLEAYGVKTYVELLNEAPENPPWYPMWSFNNAITSDTDYGKIMKQIDEAKHKYLPLLVMSSDFGKTWKEYTEVYNDIDTQIYFDELTAEVHRRTDNSK